jgi:ubiquitin-conjugating enzyme E2 A
MEGGGGGGGSVSARVAMLRVRSSFSAEECEPPSPPFTLPKPPPEHPQLTSELRELTADPPSGISASPSTEDNLFQWNATLIGPDESPWEGGIYTLRLQFPDQYPDKPPRVRFLTEMFHPNIFADGSLCLDIIQDKWKPIYTVSSILSSVQSLLCDPNTDSPANVDAAKLYKENKKEYNKRVRRCAEKSLDTS